jgi:hypothetical protein
VTARQTGERLSFRETRPRVSLSCSGSNKTSECAEDGERREAEEAG